MRKIIKFFKNRNTLIAIGVIALSLLVWFGGPFVGFASAIGRLLVILALVVIWAVIMWIRIARDARAGAAIAAAGAAKDGNPEDSADARALRESFTEATTALRKSSGGTSLYDLPWYAFIGPPGTGKTTLIDKSGLKFPVAQRSGAARKLTGVGGTRNCHWFFTDDAVLLDTAGRFTTQDSNAAADRAGWFEFLNLLKKYRRRRPLNGIFVAFSAERLARAPEEDLEAEALRIRERLDEVLGTLLITLPVYFMVTQCDLISGFIEFFDDLDTDGRRQVWGFTFNVPDSESGAALEQVGPRLAELAERLGGRVTARLNEERDLKRRVAIMSFPAQFASLQSRLDTLVHNVFSSSRFDRKLLLRGVYFTSGTQMGAPIDRIMAAVGREFGFAPQSTESQPAAGRAYFVERLLKGVVFSESGLAGTQFRVEARKALLQLAAYVGCVALATLMVVWLSVSFASNRSYLREVDEANAAFQASGVAQVAPDAPLEEMIAHLDGLRAITDVAERHGAAAPWSMRLGLYQPRAMGENARDAYVRDINNYLVPLLSEQLRDRLADVAAEPENLFESLKAYLLLHDPERYKGGKAAVASVANAEWQQRYGSDASVPARLNAHLAALLASEQLPAPPPADADRIARARGSLVGLTPARLVYARIHREYSEDPDRALHLDVAAGLHSEKVFVRRSRVALGEPFAYVYSRRAFEEISGQAAAKAVASFAADAWVFGERKPSLAEQARLPFEVLDVYEDDYIASWDRLIGDVALKSFSPAEVPEALRILSAADSPLRSFVRVITDNTNLIKPGAKSPADAAKKLGGPVAGLVRKGQAIGNALDGGRPPAGTRITEHFRPLAAAAPAVDKCLGTLTLIQQQIEAGGQGYINNNAMAALNQGGSLGLARALEDCAASLPAPLNAIMKQAAGGAQAVAVSQVRGALGDKMAQQLGAQCKQIIAGRFPFIVASANDVPIADFGRVFGSGGSLDVFFRDNLAPMVDVQGARWAWREVADAQVALGAGVLPNFQRAAWIRDAFFPQGGQQPRVQFTMTAESLDADVVRFALEFDGQRFEYRHDPPQPWSATWPGPAPGTASIRFDDRNGQGPSQTFQGPWALFRLFGTAEFQRRSETRYLVIFRAGGKSARVVLEASSIRNPFDRDMLTPFRCPG